MTSYTSLADNVHQPSLSSLFNREEFVGRHIGPNDAQIQAMLEYLGLRSLDELVEKTVPASIRQQDALDLPAPKPEQNALALLRDMMSGDKPGRSFIGLGYYATWTPNVILRNVLENPGWYTAYTPYQPEISQGRLECLLNFQQVVTDLTGMELSNASLLDEATAAAEGMSMAKRVSGNKASNVFFIDENCFPQTIDVVRTRAKGLGIELVIAAPEEAVSHDVFGALFQYPAMDGTVTDFSDLIAKLHEGKAVVVVAADIMSLVLLKPPGEMGADVVVGSTQRFGVPMGYGGPHAAYFSTRDEYRRSIPGRLIGVSVDSRGNTTYRMALQTREQHIRREKANSNICTSQVLLANMAALYAMYHGASGLMTIAGRIHRLTAILAQGLQQKGLAPVNNTFFDTLTIAVDKAALAHIQKRAESADINLRYGAAGVVGLSLDECTGEQDIETLWSVLLGEESQGLEIAAIDQQICQVASVGIPSALCRSSNFLSHPVFSAYQSETEMLRYLKKLEDRDISLTRSMIPLGSCTMKLNATAEMLPISWPAFSAVHPFTPMVRVPGYQKMLDSFEAMLMAITGFDAVCMQPNSGAQGEYAGLYAIRNYLDARGDTQRNICLIPSSAHGTNPASAHMVGMKVVIVACDNEGNVDVEDLRAKTQQHSDTLAALMVTYPSTHGVYEEGIREICAIVHEHGGQVYLDGANLNAQVGLTRPADIGADVSHVNLHKTFCIPHGGGGPGMGPIGVRQHLVEHLPNHSVMALVKPAPGNSAVSAAPNSAVSAAPWGSASILPISWMYIAMMGGSGLTRATQVAILNANYIARKLSSHYSVLYTGRNDMVAHECIIDLRPLKQSSGITDEDIAKRLIDFGYHAPTMSFPVAGTLMIEPTESETQDELDRFIEAMTIIRREIVDVESGKLDRLINPLKKAPHTLVDILDDDWDRPYSRQQAAFPAEWVRAHKYWPPVNRVDNVYGDKNLFCSCPSIEDYL